MLARFVVLLAVLVACEGPVGPQGPQGERGLSGLDGKDGVDGRDGRDGADLWIQVAEGTISNRHYTEGNPRYVSIPLSDSSREPTVLSFDVESDNGGYIEMQSDFPVIALRQYRGDLSISGYEDWWYALVSDRHQDLLGYNYRVKFVQ